MNELNPEKAIFAAAQQLPPEDRAAYLDEACGDNGPLRRRIEALLNASEQSGAFLEVSAAPTLRRTPAASIPLAEKPGDKVGRYKLLQQIGEGGCGVVYMAEQEEPVRRARSSHSSYRTSNSRRRRFVVTSSSLRDRTLDPDQD